MYFQTIQLSNYTYLSAIISALLVITSISMGTHALIRYFREKKKLLPVLALFSFSLSYEIVTVSDFVSVISTGQHLPFYSAAILAFSLQPISMVFGMSLGLHLFFPKYMRKGVLITLLIVLIDFILLFGFTSDFVTQTISPFDGLIVMALGPVLLGFMMIFISTGFVMFCVKFFQLSKRVENPERKYLRLISLGWLFICMGGVTGAALEGSTLTLGLIIVFGKLLMTIGIVLNYVGFLPSSSGENSK